MSMATINQALYFATVWGSTNTDRLLSSIGCSKPCGMGPTNIHARLELRGVLNDHAEWVLVFDGGIPSDVFPALRADAESKGYTCGPPPSISDQEFQEGE